MCQIKDTLKHEGVPNVATKELLKITDNGEPKECSQELCRTEVTGPISFLHQQ